jgi:hypothetical protein
LDGDVDSMNRFCINRHQQAINGVYLDYHVDKIWLKQLWHVRWSKRFDVNKPGPNWATEAPWMISFKGSEFRGRLLISASGLSMLSPDSLPRELVIELIAITGTRGTEYWLSPTLSPVRIDVYP